MDPRFCRKVIKQIFSLENPLSLAEENAREGFLVSDVGRWGRAVLCWTTFSFPVCGRFLRRSLGGDQRAYCRRCWQWPGRMRRPPARPRSCLLHRPPPPWRRSLEDWSIQPRCRDGRTRGCCARSPMRRLSWRRCPILFLWAARQIRPFFRRRVPWCSQKCSPPLIPPEFHLTPWREYPHGTRHPSILHFPNLQWHFAAPLEHLPSLPPQPRLTEPRARSSARLFRLALAPPFPAPQRPLVPSVRRRSQLLLPAFPPPHSSRRSQRWPPPSASAPLQEPRKPAPAQRGRAKHSQLLWSSDSSQRARTRGS